MKNLNGWFYPNACYVCHVYGKDVKTLWTCNGCGMISYCTVAHWKQHRAEHKPICEIIKAVRAENNRPEPRHLTQMQWYRKKEDFMNAVMKRMDRPMEEYEKDMFLFQKNCVICHRQFKRGSMLYRCGHCASASFCAEHRSSKEHIKYCSQYRLNFLVNKAPMDFRSRMMPYLQQVSRKYFSSMKSFINLYAIPYYNKLTKEDLSIETPWLLRHTEYVSDPLTVFSALRRLRFNPVKSKERLVVHSVGVSVLDAYDVNAWELLFHLEPTLITLVIVMIGPDVSNVIEYELCEDCIKANKKLITQCTSMSYYTYMNHENYTQPDIIAALNVGIHKVQYSAKYDTEICMPSMELLAAVNRPYIFTSDNASDIRDVKIQARHLDDNISPIYCSRNKFASLRPHIYNDKDGVYYDNEHAIIYEGFRK